MTNPERQALREVALKMLNGAELYRVLSLIDGPFKDDPVGVLDVIRGYVK